MNNDEQHNPDTAMERMMDFGRRLFRVSKEDLKRVEEAAESVVDDALGPPPATGRALADEED